MVVVGYSAGDEPAPEPPFEPGAGVDVLPGDPPPAAEVVGELPPEPAPLPGAGEPFPKPPLSPGVGAAPAVDGDPAPLVMVQSQGSVTVYVTGAVSHVVHSY